jgi:hypothetical protein
MPDFKKHHFVPQFYLRGFSLDASSVGSFQVRNRIFIPRASIRGQCQRSFLYGKDSGVENILGELETEIAPFLKELAKAKRFTWPSSSYVKLLTYLHFQIYRTPKSGEAMDAMATMLMREAFREGPGIPTEVSANIDRASLKSGNPTLHSMSLSAGMTPLLFDLEPRLLANESSVEFITSDCPVVKFNQWCQDIKFMGVTGLASRGLQIIFPINPRLLLLLFDPDTYSVGGRGSGILTVNSSFEVEGLNALQLTGCENSIYFTGNSDTYESICRMPMQWFEEAKKSVVFQTAKEDGSKHNKLFVYYDQIVGRLGIQSIKIRGNMRNVDEMTRGKMTRPLAERYARELRGKADLPDPSTLGNKRFSVVKTQRGFSG